MNNDIFPFEEDWNEKINEKRENIKNKDLLKKYKKIEDDFKRYMEEYLKKKKDMVQLQN